MGAETPVAIDDLIAGPRRRTAKSEGARIENRIAALILALVPGGLVLYFSFNGGGFFPGTVAFACVVAIQLLIVRVLLGDHPFEGVSRTLVFTGAALVGFVTWILLSGLWSHAHDRTLIEFDRGLLYLTIFLLFGFVARTASRIPWLVRGLALAVVVVGSVGAFSRLRPDVVHTTNAVAANRLAYPLTYWNALGILCAIGVLLLLGLAASRSEPPVVNALASGAVPILALTIYFTFSRGALLALAVGLVAYVVTARSRGTPGTVLATVPTSVVVVVSAYHQSELASTTPKPALAVSQGDHVLHVAIGCAVAAALIRVITLAVVDRPLGRVTVTPQMRRAGWLTASGAVACALIVAIAAGAPHWLSREYHGFTHGPKNVRSDLRLRFTDPSSNGRIDHWRASVQQFDAQPFHGSGAGTFEFVWAKRRKIPLTVVDAHSLYVEVLGELGIVGFLLLVTVVASILVGMARRIRGDNRVLYAALFAAGVAWTVHAGVDWDWEMPAVTAWFFAVGGAVLAARSGQLSPGAPAAQRSRVPIAVALVVAAGTPALLLFSQSSLQASARAFDSGNCTRAKSQAFKSIDDLGIRPEPYLIVGYCDIREGRPAEAISAMGKAVEKSPRNWQCHYGLAMALAAAGRDPRPEIGLTLAMDPQEDFVKAAATAFDATSTPKGWRRAARAQVDAGLGSGKLSFQ
jgi:O-antigen ligase/polysaccharide polymerase Wzy-like membrane protein